MAEEKYITIGGERVRVDGKKEAEVQAAPEVSTPESTPNPETAPTPIVKKATPRKNPKATKRNPKGAGRKPGPGSMQMRVAMPQYAKLMEMAAAHRWIGPQAAINKLIDEAYDRWKGEKNEHTAVQ